MANSKHKTSKAARIRLRGKAFENRIARILRGVEAYRGQCYSVFKDARRGRQWTKGECDVEGTPFWIECAAEHYQGNTSAIINRKRKQAERDQAETGDKRPIVVVVNNTAKRSERIQVGFPLAMITGQPSWMGIVEQVVVSLDEWIGRVLPKMEANGEKSKTD